MSLFPAYSTSRNIQESSFSDVEGLSKENSNTWLTNSSFKSEIAFKRPVIYISSTSSEDESIPVLSFPEEEKVPEKIITLTSDSSEDERHKSKKRHKKKKKKHKSRKVKPEQKYEPQVENVYSEDKIRDKRMCTVETLCSRVRPFYNSSRRNLGFIAAKYSKKKVIPRYYLTNIDVQSAKKPDTVIKRTKSVEKHEETLPEWCVNIDEERKNRTQEFNEKLEQNPHDVELWLRYVDFQDVIVTFQPRNTNSRLACQKKLAIVEKALEKNSDSVELLKTKLLLMSELTPADQFSNDVDALLNKDSGNITLWQALIMATQSSIAFCTVPSVLNLFTRCFFILRQRSRTNPRFYDAQILGTIYQCLTFLRHGGLWEQMWETIRMNLCLNLNLSRESLRFQSSIDEKNLIGLEEVILTSKLPLNQLWLRVESLRERCHWISVTSDKLELVGDSKRFVLTEDVADFVHPVVSDNSNFQLAVYALLSLKVPLLPTRDNTLKDLGLKELNWIFDSSEVLLPLAYPCVGEMAGYLKRKSLVENVIEGQLTSGPQFLRFHPAQEPYLDFVRSSFRVIAEALPSSQRTSIYVWWLRFERLLVYFGKDDPLKSDNRGKRLKTILKEFLKKSENRNNLHFYREFALIEYEQGRTDSALSILEMALQSENCCPATMSNTEEKAAVLSIFRCLFEILLNTSTYQETNKCHFIKIALLFVPKNAEDRLLIVESYLREFIEQFLLNEAPEESEDAFFMPNLVCDSIACYAYILLVEERDVMEILDVFEKCLNHSKDSPRLQERLYESELVLLQLYVEKFPNSKSLLKNVLGDVMRSYPDSFYVLSVFADVQYELPFWKQTNKHGKIRLWQAITMCLVENTRIKYLKKAGLIDTANAVLNKLLSFHRKLSRDPDIRHCPLLWRLFMLLLREENLCEKKGEEVYHDSVSHCPWARSIYIDAAEIAPQQLTEIQDVIREKELRIHVTPEELDILRG